MSRVARLKTFAASFILVISVLLPSAAMAANLSHAYRSSGSIPKGSLVSLQSGSSKDIEMANTGNGNRLIGVVVTISDSLLAVDSGQGTQVATSGTATALVSTLNGDVKVGDQISVSPLSGIGMKAGPDLRLVGLAQSTLNDKSANTNSLQITTQDGKARTIKVGYVRLNIAVGNGASSGDTKLTPLQKITKSLTGHVVPTPRIIASLVITVVSLIALTILLYASVYGSIISVGRNPLAKEAVMRTLTSVLIIAVLIAGIAGTSVFFLMH